MDPRNCPRTQVEVLSHRAPWFETFETKIKIQISLIAPNIFKGDHSGENVAAQHADNGHPSLARSFGKLLLQNTNMWLLRLKKLTTPTLEMRETNPNSSATTDTQARTNTKAGRCRHSRLQRMAAALRKCTQHERNAAVGRENGLRTGGKRTGTAIARKQLIQPRMYDTSNSKNAS